MFPSIALGDFLLDWLKKIGNFTKQVWLLLIPMILKCFEENDEP